MNPKIVLALFISFTISFFYQRITEFKIVKDAQKEYEMVSLFIKKLVQSFYSNREISNSNINECRNYVISSLKNMDIFYKFNIVDITLSSDKNIEVKFAMKNYIAKPIMNKIFIKKV